MFDNKDLDIDGITSDMKIEDLIYATCRGGWPAFLNMKSDKAKLLIARNYVDAICRDDISRVEAYKGMNGQLVQYCVSMPVTSQHWQRIPLC